MKTAFYNNKSESKIWFYTYLLGKRENLDHSGASLTSLLVWVF